MPPWELPKHMPAKWFYRELLARRAQYAQQVKQRADLLSEQEGGWTKLTAKERKVLLSLEEDW